MDIRHRYVESLKAAQQKLTQISKSDFLRRFRGALDKMYETEYRRHQDAIGSAVNSKLMETDINQKQIAEFLNENTANVNFLLNGKKLPEKRTAVFDAFFQSLHDSRPKSALELLLLAKREFLIGEGLPNQGASITLDDLKIVSSFIRFHEVWYFETADSPNQEKHRDLLLKIIAFASEKYRTTFNEELDWQRVKYFSQLYAVWGAPLFAFDWLLKSYSPWKEVLD